VELSDTPSFAGSLLRRTSWPVMMSAKPEQVNTITLIHLNHFGMPAFFLAGPPYSIPISVRSEIAIQRTFL
jgi:hypothetical protein